MNSGSRRVIPSSGKKKITDRLLSKASCISKSFVGYRFVNISLKGSLLCRSNFKDGEFVGVDFVGANVKKCNFSNATFKSCIFVGVRLNGTKFSGAKFINCFFVNQSFAKAKNLIIGDESSVLQYPESLGSNELRAALTQLGEQIDGKFRYSRIVLLKGGKLNNLTISLLLRTHSDERLSYKIKYILTLIGDSKINAKIHSFHAFKKWIDKMCA